MFAPSVRTPTPSIAEQMNAIFDGLGKMMLAQGKSIIYPDRHFGSGCSIMEQPDGKMFFIKLDENKDKNVIVRELTDAEKER